MRHSGARAPIGKRGTAYDLPPRRRYSRIRVPPPGVPRIATDLWRHTCFEAFIAVEGLPAYHEFNFAPSGEWAIYAFAGYRDGGPLANEMFCGRTLPCAPLRVGSSSTALSGSMACRPSTRVPASVSGSRR